MGKTKNSLTIKNWIREETLVLAVNSGYSLSSRTVGANQYNKLTVTRKSDKHSTRLRLMAYLRHNQPGYESIGFPEISLAIENYADNDQFISRSVILFDGAGVDSLTPNNGEETIVFVVGAYTEVTVSKTGVSIN